MSPRQPDSAHGPFLAVLLAAGAAFMLWRTLDLISGRSLVVYVWWAAGLLLLEAAIDLVTFVAAARWFVTSRPNHRRTVLRAAAAVVSVHALRVAVFVLGRTGPWIDFDIRPEERAEYATGWTWTGVAVAGSMAALSVLILFAACYRVRRNRSRRNGRSPIPRSGSRETAFRGSSR